MRIQVLYFAAARERAGVAEEMIELALDATIAEAVATLTTRHPALGPLMPYVRVAVDEVFAHDHGVVLREGAVLALIPPVSGGAPLVALTKAPLDVRAVEALVMGPDRGGVVTFTGRVRDHTGEHGVVRLEYEAYASMAERALCAIVDAVSAEYDGARVAVHHRLGVLEVGEAAVVVAVSAAHRGPAFAACAEVIERLKADVPIFKKEVRTDGSVWVGLGP